MLEDWVAKVRNLLGNLYNLASKDNQWVALGNIMKSCELNIHTDLEWDVAIDGIYGEVYESKVKDEVQEGTLLEYIH